MDDKPKAESKRPDRMPGGASPFRTAAGTSFAIDGIPAAKVEYDWRNPYDRDFLGARRRGAVTFGTALQASGGGDGAVLCKVDSKDTGVGGLQVTVMSVDKETGNLKSRGPGVLLLPEVSFGADIPAGTLIIGHPIALTGYESRKV